jgi:hypothetical protein
VLVMTDKALRLKYGWLLDDKLQALACVGGVAAMLCLAGYYQSSQRIKNNELQCLAEYPYQLCKYISVHMYIGFCGAVHMQQSPIQLQYTILTV